MNAETRSLVIVSFLGLLLTGFATYAILFKPALGDRLMKMGKSRLAPWTMQEGADVYMKALTIITFLAFLAINCFLLCKWTYHLLAK